MTVEELKAEAAKLSPAERFALAQWIEESRDIRDLRRAALLQDIQLGLDDLKKGAATECKSDAELRSFFDGVKARGRERLDRSKEPAA